MSVPNAAVSALLQVALLGGVPFLGYWLYHRWRYQRRFAEVAQRAGVQLGDQRYLMLSLAFAAAGVTILVIWPPPLAPLVRPGSAQHQFVRLGLGIRSVSLAVLNGVFQTAFAEELLFRGLIAGSLSRKLPLRRANIIQALIFLLPHFGILAVAPEVWPMLPIVFAGALVFGWVRIRSGSILGSWVMHAAGNVTMALLAATRA